MKVALIEQTKFNFSLKMSNPRWKQPETNIAGFCLRKLKS